jgi:hypothetical protein
MTPVRIFLDDDRNPPLGEDDWIVVRSPHVLLRLVQSHGGEITEISFDNDLRADLEGREAVRLIFGGPMNEPMPTPALQRVTVHSANETAARAMLAHVADAIRGGDLHPVEVRRRAANGSIYPLAIDDKRNLVVLD